MPIRTSSGRVAPALVLAVVAISFAAILFRQAQPTHPLVAAGFRLLIASALLLPLAWRGLRRGALDAGRWRLAAWGGAAYAVHFGAWVASLELTTVAASVTVVTATPLLLAVVGLVSGRDRPTARLWLALGLGAVGLVTIGVSDAVGRPLALTGNALALLGAAGMAVYMLIARAAGPDLDVLAFSAVATGVGGVCLCATALAAGVALVPSSLEALGFIALAAIAPQLVGHTLLTWALRHTTPTAVGIATLGEPVGATILAWLIVEESVQASIAVGCAVTVMGVALALLGRGQQGWSADRERSG